MTSLSRWKPWLRRGFKGLGILTGLGLAWLFTISPKAPEARLMAKVLFCRLTGIPPKEISLGSCRLDEAGNLWVVDGLGFIRLREPGGRWRVVAGSCPPAERSSQVRDGQGSKARFASPHIVGFDDVGNAWILDVVVRAGADDPGERNGQAKDSEELHSTFLLRRVSPAGKVETLWMRRNDPGLIDLNYWDSTVRTPAGALLMARLVKPQVLEFGPGGTSRPLLSGKGFQDGPAEVAKVGRTLGLASDGHGTVFFADTANRVVRRIAPDGAVTTWAGRAGEKDVKDGAGPEARFSRPWSIACNRKGEIVVQDLGFPGLRRISAEGVVTSQHLSLARTIEFKGSSPEGSILQRFPLSLSVDGQGTVLLIWLNVEGEDWNFRGGLLRRDGSTQMLFNPGPAGFVVPVD